MTRICNTCHIEKPMSDYTLSSGRWHRRKCTACEYVVIKHRRVVSTYKPHTISDKRYIDAENAKRICGLSDSQLCKHALNDSIRSIKIPSTSGCFEYRYFIDDIQALGWVTTGEIAHFAGIDNRVFSAKIARYKISGAQKICNRHRFPPRIADKLVKWISGGYPEMAGISKRAR